MSDFVPFQKIPRLSRNIVITEKIDGTNAQIVVGEDGSVRAGSRSRWITPDDDNYGFARWVADHEAELRDGLGIGQHFGEWWGSGIQRRYGLTGADKRFSLFNAGHLSGSSDTEIARAVGFSTGCVVRWLAQLPVELGGRAHDTAPVQS